MADNTILNRLDGLKLKYEEIGQKLTDPEVIADVKQFIQFNKEYRELEPIIEASERYRTAIANLAEAKDILANDKDEEMREMAREMIAELEPQLAQMEEEIKLLLIPKDPQDSKNAIVEIRGGTGGDEAAIFAGDLLRMYTKYIESKGWRYEITSFSEGTAGGYKEVVLKVSGQNVYGTLKYESGVHRVQRVPQTETQGRVHTSAASVAVLPEAEEFDIEISMNDIRKDIFCASGPGGQSVNTTYSAIRLTHIPTGIVVQCQDQKSQLKNFDKAFEELRTRVFNLEYSKYLDEIASKRKTMVSTGDRSAKIRTYNYPQGRITDHRINYTIYNLSAFMDGDIQDCIDHLIVAENAERLKESELCLKSPFQGQQGQQGQQGRMSPSPGPSKNGFRGGGRLFGRRFQAQIPDFDGIASSQRRVATYGQIARLVGMPGYARRVGHALAAAPAGLPCHRVVNSAGRTAPHWTDSGCSQPKASASGPTAASTFPLGLEGDRSESNIP